MNRLFKNYLLVFLVPCLVAGAAQAQEAVGELDAVRTKLRQRWGELEGFLVNLPGPRRRYISQKIEVEKLREVLGIPHDAHDLRERALPFYASAEGLEHPRIVAFREALDSYSEHLRFGSKTPAAEDTKQCRSEMQALIDTPDGIQDSVALGKRLEWLRYNAPDSRLANDLRNYYSYPNIVVYVKRDLVKERLDDVSAREVSENEFINTTIMGARVTGMSYMNGRVTVGVPTGADSIHVRLNGTIRSPNSKAVREPAIVYTSGTTDVQGYSQIRWEGDRFVATPVQVNANTRTRVLKITGTPSRLRLGQGIRNRIISQVGARQVEQQKTQSEREASRQAERRVSEKFSDQLAEQVRELNEQAKEMAVDPMVRVGMLPNMRLGATPDSFVVKATKKCYGGLAAPWSKPWGPYDGEIAVCVHQSALASFMQRHAGGDEWTDEYLATIQKQLIGDNSVQFRIGLHERWSVVLDDSVPVSLAISEEGIQFRVNVRELKIGDRSLEYPFQVASTCMVTPTTTALQLKRMGDVDFSWSTEHVPEDADEVAKFVKDKFGGFFLEEMYLDGLVSPEGGDWAAMSRIELTKIELRQGWLRGIFTRKADSELPEPGQRPSVATKPGPHVPSGEFTPPNVE